MVLKFMRLLALLFIAVLILSSCGRVAGGAAPELLVPVVAEIRFDSAIVERGPLLEMDVRLGFVRVESAALNFGPIAATFDTFYVLPGDTVTYGQLLARLNTEQLDAQILRQEEHIAGMRSRFDFENELRRIDIRILTAQGAGAAISNARMELDFAIERQTLQLRHAEADLQNLLDRLPAMELRAPADGTVTYVLGHTQGVWIPPFSSVLYFAAEDARIFVEYVGGDPYAHPRDIRIEAHIGSEIYTATRMWLPWEQARRYGQFVTPTRFILETETQPPPGTLVVLHFFNRQVEDVLRLPRNTMFFNNDLGFYVYRIVGNQLEMTAVSTGIHTETYVEILGGLAEGDEVYVRS